MPDSITPVGLSNTQNPLQSLSSILGIQQQRQALQLQAQQLQRSQIDTQQATGVNNFFGAVPFDQLHDAQGNVSADMAHQRPEYQALPGVARVAVDQKLNDLQGAQLKIKQALTSMNGDVVGQMGKAAEAASKMPPDQAKQFMDQFGQQGSENQRVYGLYKGGIQNIPPQHLPGFLQAIAGQAQDVTAQQPGVTQNAAGNLVGVNKATGGISQLPGAPPGSQINPSSSQVAGATIKATGGAKQVVEDPVTHNKSIVDLQASGAGTPVNPQRQPGQGEADVAAAGGLTSRIQAAKAADYDRPTVLDALSRARAILAKPDAPDLGTSFEVKTYLKNALSGMGIDTGSATDANELVKNIARAEAGRSEASPIGKTDASRSLLSKGTVSTHIDNQAALNIIDQSMASELAGRGYLKAVGKFQGNPAQAQEAESKYLATPNLIQAHELGLKRSPAEVDQFLKMNGLKKGDLDPSVQSLKAQGAL